MTRPDTPKRQRGQWGKGYSIRLLPRTNRALNRFIADLEENGWGSAATREAVVNALCLWIEDVGYEKAEAMLGPRMRLFHALLDGTADREAEATPAPPPAAELFAVRDPKAPKHKGGRRAEGA